MFVRAPYGRYERPGWGFRLPSRIGWMIMESPAIIIMTIFFGTGVFQKGTFDLIPIIFYCMWMLHYLNRTLVWPMRAYISNKKMPLSIVLFAIIFNSINSWINSEWIFGLNYQNDNEWLFSPQFISGLKKSSVEIDRKILAELAVNQPEAFKALVEKAQSAN